MQNKKKIFLGICLIFIMSPIIINPIWILIFSKITLPIYFGTNIEWLKFIGLFLGSGFTLIGVNWQLNEQEKRKKKEIYSKTLTAYIFLINEVKKIENNIKYLFSDWEIFRLFLEENDGKPYLEPQHDKKEIFKKINKNELKNIFNDKLILSFIINIDEEEKKNIIEYVYELLELLNCIKLGIEDIKTNEYLLLSEINRKYDLKHLKTLENLKIKIEKSKDSYL